MSEPLLIAELVPLLLSGAAMVVAAGVLWLKGPRNGLINSLTLLLVFLGHLALVVAMIALPNDPGFAPRLLPVFQLAAVGAGLAFLIFLFEPHLEERRLDALLSSVIVAAVALIALTLWHPQLYWGDAYGRGPLYAATGLRTAVFAAIAWLLAAHALAARPLFRQVPRAAAYLLSAGFALVAVHDAVTDTLDSALGGSAAPSAAYLGAPLIVGLFLHLGWQTRFARGAATRRQAGQYLLVGLLPALFSVLVVDLVVLRLVSGERAALFLDLVLRHLWMTALAASSVWMLRPSGKRTPRPRSAPVGGRRPAGAPRLAYPTPSAHARIPPLSHTVTTGPRIDNDLLSTRSGLERD